jgi:hypothetical protein
MARTQTATTSTDATPNGQVAADASTTDTATDTVAAATVDTATDTDADASTDADAPVFDFDAMVTATIVPDMDAVQAAWKEKAVRTPRGTASITDTPYYKIVAHYAQPRALPNGTQYTPGMLVQIPWSALAALPSMQPNAAVAARGRADRPQERTYKILATAAASLTPAMYVDPITDSERQKAAAHLAPDTCAFTMIPLEAYTARVEARASKRAAAAAARFLAAVVKAHAALAAWWHASTATDASTATATPSA